MKIIRSIGYPWNGIIQASKDQLNLRVHFLIASGVVVAGICFKITAIEWILCLLTIGMVISLELVNSAVENLVDLVTKEHHPIAGKAKDIAAGAVLCSAFLAIAVGVIIFTKYIF